MISQNLPDNHNPLDPGASDVLDEPLRRIKQYWETLPAPRGVPSTADVDPNAIASQLGTVMLIDRVATGDWKVRLAGRHLVEAMSFDPNGLSLGAIFSMEGRGTLPECMAALFDEAKPVNLRLRGLRRPLCPAPRANLLLLPLADAHGRTCRAIGAMTLDPVSSHGMPGYVVETWGVTSGPLISPVDAAFDEAEAVRRKIRQRDRARAALTVIDGGVD